nr:IQ domain containing protein D [Hymenolepis microstoma]
MSSEQGSTAIWNNLPSISDGVTTTEKPEAEFPQKAADLTILKPTQKHVPTVEGKQVMQIMDNCISKVILVSAFPKFTDNLTYYELLLGGEVCEQIERYKAASTAYDTIMNDFQNEGDQYHCKLKELKERIINTTRQIIHYMLAEPGITSALIKHYQEWKVEPEGTIRELASYLVQFRFMMRHQLLFSSQETAEREEFLEQTQRHGNRQAQVIRRLEEQLDSMMKKRNKMLETKIQEIERINSCLLSREEETAAKINEMREGFLKEYQEARKQHKKTVSIMLEEVAEAKKRYENEIAPVQKQELMIRRRKWMLEDQLYSTIRKMDEQLFKLQIKYDDNKKEFDEIVKDYDSLNAKFEPLKVRYDEVMEIRRKEEEARQQEIKEHTEMIESATFITALYRAYLARKRIRLERRKGIL